MRVALRTSLACVGYVFAVCGHAQSGVISITNHDVETYVGTFIPASDFNSAFYTGTALDGVDHVSTATHGVGSYSTTVNLSEQAQGATLSYQFGGSTTGSGASAQSLAGVQFTASGDNLSYSLSGNYSYAYPGPYDEFNTNLFADYYVHLRDLTANVYLFRNNQGASFALGPFSFALGGTDGNFTPTLEGSLNGLLIDTHQYELYYSADSRVGRVDSATTEGGVLLTIVSQASEVPEPASCTLIGLGTLGMGFVVRRRRAAAATL